MSRELRAAHQEYRRYLPLFGEHHLQEEFGCIEEVNCADNTGCTELLRERSRSGIVFVGWKCPPRTVL